MISSLHGTVIHIGLSSAVIDVGGVGLLVQATPRTLTTLRLNETVRLTTTLIVREDSLTLYGFCGPDELEVFEALLTVGGVGPRLALAVLAVLEPEVIRFAASTGDGKTFTKVPGIGPKVAGRIVLELAGKLMPPENGAMGGSASGGGDQAWKTQVVEAMMSLGWSEKDSLVSIEKAVADEPELRASGDVAKILRATLAWLGQDSRRTATGVGSQTDGGDRA